MESSSSTVPLPECVPPDAVLTYLHLQTRQSQAAQKFKSEQKVLTDMMRDLSPHVRAWLSQRDKSRWRFRMSDVQEAQCFGSGGNLALCELSPMMPMTEQRMGSLLGGYLADHAHELPTHAPREVYDEFAIRAASHCYANRPRVVGAEPVIRFTPMRAANAAAGRKRTAASMKEETEGEECMDAGGDEDEEEMLQVVQRASKTSRLNIRALIMGGSTPSAVSTTPLAPPPPPPPALYSSASGELV